MTAAVAFPAFCAEALKDALLLCADTLIPALFLYITAANLLSSCGAFAPFSKTSAGRAFRRLTGLSDAGAAAFAVGTVSGFPSGALFLARMKNAGGIGEDEAARLMPFVNNASPAFVVGAVGSLFGSPAFGTALFAAQCVASFSGILIEKAVFGKAENACRSLAGEDFYSAFPRAVRESVFSMLAVCGFVALFSVPCRALESAGRAGAFLSSALEIGNGCAAAGRAGSLSAAAFAVGFSGISVMFQTADISLRAGISMRYWIIGKLYSSIVCLAAINMLAFFDLL